MMEEFLVGRAEVIETGFSLRCRHKAVLRTFSIACEAHIAMAAKSGQRITFCTAKLLLLVRLNQRCKRIIHNVAELVLGIDIMIAGIHVAVVLEHQRLSAGFSKDAETRRHAQPEFERHIEELNKTFPDIVSHPLVKNCAEETSENIRLNRPIGDLCRMVRRAK